MNRQKLQAGFTIIEIMVVVTVIGILVGIVTFSVSGWRERTAVTEVSTALQGAAAAMEDYRNFNSTYPATIPASYVPSNNVTVTLSSSTASTYCVQATNTVITNVIYHVDDTTRTPKTGGC